MKEHTIQVSDDAYQLLLEQAARLEMTPEQLIEHLLMADAIGMLTENGVRDQSSITTVGAAGAAEALAAVQRLTILFADVNIEHLEETLNDPMLALSNADLS